MRNSLIIAVVLASTGQAAMLASTEAVFASDQLTIISFGGAIQAAERKVFFGPLDACLAK